MIRARIDLRCVTTIPIARTDARDGILAEVWISNRVIDRLRQRDGSAMAWARRWLSARVTESRRGRWVQSWRRRM